MCLLLRIGLLSQLGGGFRQCLGLSFNDILVITFNSLFQFCHSRLDGSTLSTVYDFTVGGDVVLSGTSTATVEGLTVTGDVTVAGSATLQHNDVGTGDTNYGLSITATNIIINSSASINVVSLGPSATSAGYRLPAASGFQNASGGSGVNGGSHGGPAVAGERGLSGRRTIP